MKVFRQALLLSAAVGFCGFVYAASGPVEERLDPKAGIERLLQMAEMKRIKSPSVPRIIPIVQEISEIDRRLSSLVGAEGLKRLRSFHRAKGPCFRYGPIPSPGRKVVAEAVKRFGLDFVKRGLWRASIVVEDMEYSVHGRSADVEYREIVRESAAGLGTEGMDSYYVGLLDRRKDLFEKLALLRPAPEVEVDFKSSEFKELIRSFPSLVYPPNVLEAYQILAAVETEKILRSAALKTDINSCGFPKGAAVPVDGWGRAVLTERRGSGCFVVSFGKDGERGGAGLDADVEVRVVR